MHPNSALATGRTKENAILNSSADIFWLHLTGADLISCHKHPTTEGKKVTDFKKAVDENAAFLPRIQDLRARVEKFASAFQMPGGEY